MTGIWQQSETKLYQSMAVVLAKFANGELDEDKFIVNPPTKDAAGNISMEKSLDYITKCQEVVDELTSLCAIVDAAYTWYNYKFDRLKDLHIGEVEATVASSDEEDKDKKPKRTNAEQRKAKALSNTEVTSAGNAMIAANTLKTYLEKHRGAAQNRLVSAWNLNKSLRGEN